MQLLTDEWSLPRGLYCDVADRLGKQLLPRLFYCLHLFTFGKVCTMKKSGSTLLFVFTLA